jgi:hypothetical protein
MDFWDVLTAISDKMELFDIIRDLNINDTHYASDDYVKRIGKFFDTCYDIQQTFQFKWLLTNVDNTNEFNFFPLLMNCLIALSEQICLNFTEIKKTGGRYTTRLKQSKYYIKISSNE